MTGAIFYGNILYTIGSILVAASATVRSYHFMLAANVILALGDIPTQVSQYKIFSSWFPPNHGFASTLGFELGLGKIGGFVGKSTANVISKRLGFAWVFWMAVVMNVFTNIVTLIFYLFTRYTQKMYSPAADPATGEKLTLHNKRFELKKALAFLGPYVFRCFPRWYLCRLHAECYRAGRAEVSHRQYHSRMVYLGRSICR